MNTVKGLNETAITSTDEDILNILVQTFYMNQNDADSE